MNNPFQKGDTKTFKRKVEAKDFAEFDSGAIHHVMSTFALVRDAEWAGRLFVLEMKQENEEGIGSFVEVKHMAPAFENEIIIFESTFESITEKGEIITSFVAKVDERLVAIGKTGQRILEKEKIKTKFDQIKNQNG